MELPLPGAEPIGERYTGRVPSMSLDQQTTEQLALLVADEKRWREVRRVPLDRQLEVLQAALVNAWTSGGYDPSRGSLAGWFRTILVREIAHFFADEHRREVVYVETPENTGKEVYAESTDDVLSPTDAGMDVIEALGLGAEVAKAAVSAFKESSKGIREAVDAVSDAVEEIPLGDFNNLDKARVLTTVAAKLKIEVGAVKTRLSRFAGKFAEQMNRGEEQNRVNVFLVIQLTQRSELKMNSRNVFLSGDVSNSVVVNGDVWGINVDFQQVAEDMRRVAAVVAADRDIPAEVKSDVLEHLDDIRVEARSAVPEWEVITGLALKAAGAFPSIVEIARTVGVTLFG
jgi:DNA-directed RNA polymerase specialized sigma24 family protein